MYGNMSQQEKAMNKDDLHAYKRFDNNQYALIPGFNSQKALAMPRDKKASPSNSTSKEAKLKTSVDRLAGYGFSHLGASGSEKVLPNIPTRPDLMASINKNHPGEIQFNYDSLPKQSITPANAYVDQSRVGNIHGRHQS